MSDRLADLQRQRFLAQEQVAWFDREIAKEARQSDENAPPQTTVATAVRPTAPAAAASADEILARYGSGSQDAAKDVKRGCYIYFAVAMGTVVLGALGVYLFYTRYR